MTPVRLVLPPGESVENRIHTNRVAPRKHLLVGGAFRCPYCDKSWERGGGRREGFVKSAALNHVLGCYEVALFLRGYWMDGHPMVAPIVPGSRDLRRLVALTARRKATPYWPTFMERYGPAAEDGRV
jgi:hypothetical protein